VGGEASPNQWLDQRLLEPSVGGHFPLLIGLIVLLEAGVFRTLHPNSTVSADFFGVVNKSRDLMSP